MAAAAVRRLRCALKGGGGTSPLPSYFVVRAREGLNRRGDRAANAYGGVGKRSLAAHVGAHRAAAAMHTGSTSARKAWCFGAGILVQASGISVWAHGSQGRGSRFIKVLGLEEPWDGLARCKRVCSHEWV